MPSTPASLLAALALTSALVGVTASTSATTAPSTRAVSVETQDGMPDADRAPEHTDTIAIECGGYDEDGAVVTEAATRIDRAPVDAAGIPEIPPVCGGYTADGTFIGDD